MLIKDFGFSVVDPSKLSIKEQMRCFKNANIIVGVHGGGAHECVIRKQSTGTGRNV